MLAGCASTPAAEVVYDSSSWETMIPASCTAFSDGCNQCMRLPESDDAACTKMFCETYTEPTCLDEELAKDPVIQPEATVDTSAIAASYVGLSLDDATAQAAANNTVLRVVVQDGEALPVNFEYLVGRINATIDDGVVTSVEVE